MATLGFVGAGANTISNLDAIQTGNQRALFIGQNCEGILADERRGSSPPERPQRALFNAHGIKSSLDIASGVKSSLDFILISLSRLVLPCANGWMKPFVGLLFYLFILAVSHCSLFLEVPTHLCYCAVVLYTVLPPNLVTVTLHYFLSIG